MTIRGSRHFGEVRSESGGGDATPAAVLRQAVRADVPGIQRVRHGVRENRLTSCVITDAEVVEAIELTGRGWVVEVDGQVVGFAVGNARTGNIWALFVDPDHEARGHGRRLHDAMLAWLWSQGLRRLWLSTEPETRAQHFYERAGWIHRGPLPGGEILFEQVAGTQGGQRAPAPV